MIIIINGSFGAGKSTAAALLRNTMKGSVVYDPEWAGLALMRLPKWLGLKGSGTGDFQDIALWRKFTVAGIRVFRLFASGPVLVPMTFSRRDYLGEITAGIRKFDDDVRIFCLRAGIATLNERLARRGERAIAAEWIARRNEECAAAHRDPHFGEPVDTENKTADHVADEIRLRIANK